MHEFNIDTVKKVLFYIGVAAAAVAVWMTFSYGRSMSFAHGVSMALLTMVAAFIWTAADHFRKSGMRVASGVLMALGVMFTAVEYFSHIGYTVGNRLTVTEETGVQNASYANTQDSVKDDVDMRKVLQARYDELKAANPWVASATTEGLRSEIEALEGDYVFKRSKSCANVTIPESRKFCDKRAELKKRVAATEEFNGVAKQLEALSKSLTGKREVASKAEFKSSPIVNQTKFAAQLVTMDIAPSAEALNWTQIVIGAMIAFVTTFLAPTCFFIVFGNSKGESHERQPRNVGAAQSASPTTPRIINNTITDKSTARAIREAITSSYGNGNAYA